MNTLIKGFGHTDNVNMLSFIYSGVYLPRYLCIHEQPFLLNCQRKVKFLEQDFKDFFLIHIKAAESLYLGLEGVGVQSMK